MVSAPHKRECGTAGRERRRRGKRVRSDLILDLRAEAGHTASERDRERWQWRPVACLQFFEPFVIYNSQQVHSTLTDL